MALDGVFLYSIINELKNTIIGCKVDKINQPEKDEILLNIRGNRCTNKLLISASSNYPRIQLTKISKQNPLKPPLFCMILRKYLNGSKIIDIRQLNCDRLLSIDFQTVDELGFDSIYSLIIEIMGRHSNITLIRQRDNIIMDSVKHISSDINTYRKLYPGIEYVFPPESHKLNPLDFNFDEFKSFISENSIDFSEICFAKIFTGISKQLSKELFYRSTNSKLDLSCDNIKNLYDYLTEIFQCIKTNKFNFVCYSDLNNYVKDFHCIELTILKDMFNKTVYDSPSYLIEHYYYQKDKNDRLKNRSADLQKLIHTNLDRCNKKVKILNKTLQKCKSKGEYKLFGELLTANIYNIKKGDTKTKVLNYYSSESEYITIKLDENKTPSENVQNYYKKYNKLKTSERMANIQLEITEKEISYLESVLTNIENAESYDEIDEIKKELIETGYLKFKKHSKGNKKKKSQPLHFISSDGSHIYVGKNNLQNDFLTLKFARKSDIWMHTKNIHGSHVIIKNDGNISGKTLEEAASIAAYYSKAKNSTKVPIDYTEVKNVRKPSGAKPGMVIYYTNKTIYIDPKKPELEMLLK
ncbi:NFACT family protein [Haloimpatiens sp. FM7330]|uniref:Rqc2 family fibronectin-binding protein n=1 Tax=Haloimpatiens sp. FM7330 TaxID=3298610 RepID=UPI00363F51F2